ncbi:glycerophosphodiester phosphodiesterase [Alkalicoccus luteus]|uniref:Glycerophosphodiester phosphodiesterase n=1 Tax=Alkalicoccus luteus TaxID=1237094 RepID=A0A969PU16_9BACI|nr:glycerophosphodiester phosphodiesterase family protein [Alkalicoccus luteus]NJP39119.1 glycerophosphodiester phosphodiesterase [Alkalicoccus luteus]
MRPIIMAHRGFSRAFPENTMIAFREAVAAGAEGIELDVQPAEEGRLVVIHDHSLDRTTEGCGLVRQRPFDYVTSLSAGNWFDTKFADERVPSLERVLQWAQHHDVQLNIELKHLPEDRKRTAIEAVRLLKLYPQRKRPVISSFDHPVLRMLEGAEADKALLSAGAVLEPERYKEEHGITGLHVHYSMLTPAEIRWLEGRGIAVRMYTVNHPDDLEQLCRLRCSCVITDDPALALRIRNKAQQPAK